MEISSSKSQFLGEGKKTVKSFTGVVFPSIFPEILWYPCISLSLSAFLRQNKTKQQQQQKQTEARDFFGVHWWRLYTSIAGEQVPFPHATWHGQKKFF